MAVIPQAPTIMAHVATEVKKINIANRADRYAQNPSGGRVSKNSNRIGCATPIRRIPSIQAGAWNTFEANSVTSIY